jgi:6-pyruvoyl tetrahydropterin synthase
VIKSFTYTISHTAKFTAARTVDEIVTGCMFVAVIQLSSEELTDDVVLERQYLNEVVNVFNNKNLNELIKVPTTERIARAIAQAVLDFLFRMELDKKVRLEAVRVREDFSDWSQVCFNHSQGEE